MRVLRNSLFNLAGGVLPALIALGTVPFIVRGLGDSGYGVFTLVTSIVGYFALLDINVTAGSIKYVAEFHASGQKQRLNETLSFGLLIYVGIGVVGAILLYTFSGPLIRSVFSIPYELEAIAENCLRVGALGFLLGQIQTYLQSVPQALMRYDISSRFEAGFGMLLPLLTVALLAFGFGLFEIVVLRVVAGAIHCAILWLSIQKILPDFRPTLAVTPVARELLAFSGYSFLSRIAALTYAHADKLIIGALIDVKALAYYTVAATLANRILGTTFRLSGVLFPVASALAAHGRIDELKALYLKASRYVVFLNASILLFIAVFAYPILYYWIGSDFAEKGVAVLSIIACAQFVDSMTNIPSLVNDGLGHPHVSGGFAISRAIIGLTALYLGVNQYGIVGAAIAHLGTAMLMTVAFLVYVHGRTVPCNLSDLVKRSYTMPLSGVLVLAAMIGVLVKYLGFEPINLLLLSVIYGCLLIIFGYQFVLSADDRANARIYVRRAISSRG